MNAVCFLMTPRGRDLIRHRGTEGKATLDFQGPRGEFPRSFRIGGLLYNFIIVFPKVLYTI